MSAAVLCELQQLGILTVQSLGDLWSLHALSCYPYFTDREMRYSQLRTLFRQHDDDRVREAILADLLPGTGYVATKLDADMDIDGDGDVDTDDAMRACLRATRGAAEMTEQIYEAGRCDAARRDALRQGLQEVIASALKAQQILTHLDAIEARRPRPRKCQPIGTAARKAVMR